MKGKISMPLVLNFLIVSMFICRLTENNVSLQKEILSACLLKQPWLFRRLMERYINLLKYACIKVADSVEYDAFCEHKIVSWERGGTTP